MAKFCGSCGAQLDDNDKVCGQCGNPVGGNAKVQVDSFVSPEMKEKAKKRKSLVISGFLCIIAVVVCIFGLVNFTGKRGLVRKVVRAYDKEDASGLVDIVSSVYELLDMDDDELEDEFEDVIDYTISDFEDDVGHSYKLSYEIIEIYELSNKKMDDFFESVFYDDTEDVDIKKVFIAEINLTAKHGKKSSSEEISIAMSREHGKMKLLAIE